MKRTFCDCVFHYRKFPSKISEWRVNFLNSYSVNEFLLRMSNRLSRIVAFRGRGILFSRKLFGGYSTLISFDVIFGSPWQAEQPIEINVINIII